MSTACTVYLKNCPCNKLPMSKTALVVVAFYKPQADDPLLNRVVGSLDGPSCHVELAFPVQQNAAAAGMFDLAMDAVCVYFDERVEMCKKRYSRDNYQLMYVPVTPQQWKSMRARAADIVRSQAAFSRYAMLATFAKLLPTLHDAADPDATCCSVLTAQILQAGGVLDKSINSRRVTPSSLQRLILQQTHVPALAVGCAPIKLQKLRVQCA